MSSAQAKLFPGTLLQGRYMILKEVGGGGMGIVYKASDDHVANRLVAIKEMKQEQLTQEQLTRARKQFSHEVKILNLLKHPNLPRIYDSFEEQGHSYLVMEFIEGATLLEQLHSMRRQPLPVQLVLEYALQLCDVLTYLHTRHDPVIFRDLKPENVMIAPDGHVYLIDFGIARFFKKGQVGDTEAFGTKGYIAPEVGFAQTDARSDLYSLGATLHHCLTCQRPDYADQQFRFPHVLDYNPQVPAELDVLIASMVEYRPQDRPESAAEVKQRLEAIQRQMVSLGNISPLAPIVDPFYSVPTAHGSFYTAPTVRDQGAGGLQVGRPPAGWANRQATPTSLAWLIALYGFLRRGVVLVLLPLMGVLHRVLVFFLSPEFRHEVYDWYLHIRVKLNTAEIWTTPFLLLSGSLCTGTILFGILIYTHSGNSYYRTELGIVFVLLVAIIVVGGMTKHAVPGNILLCSGFFVALAFLTLLVSPDVRHASSGTGQAITLNHVVTYGLITAALIALIGKIATRGVGPTRQAGTSTYWFTRLSHLTVMAVATICFILQYFFGKQAELLFAPATLHPFAVSIQYPVTLNDLALCFYGGIAVVSLFRLMQPFNRFDRGMILILALLFSPMQYTFGLAELQHTFTITNEASLVFLNLLLLMMPVVLGFLALFPLPAQLEWIGQLALLALTLACGYLQNYLGGRESFPLLSSNVHHLSEGASQLTAFSQLIFYGLGVAVVLLFVRVFARRSNAADRIALLVVALGGGLIQWSFWQGEIQQMQGLMNTEQATNILYGSSLSLVAGYAIIVIAGLALLVAACNALFHLPVQYSWLQEAEKVMARLNVLGVALICLLLLGFFGNQSTLLALSFHPSDIMTGAPDIDIAYNWVLIALLACFTFIALLRLKYPFGWVERVVMLGSGITCMMLLAGERNVQRMPLLSSNMQQVTGDVFSWLTIDRLVGVCVLLTALISFFWLLRGKLAQDRIALSIIFGLAAVGSLLRYLGIPHIVLLFALILLMQGVLLTTQIERVRHGTLTS